MPATLPILCLLVQMDLSRFWKNASLSRIRAARTKKQLSKRESLRTRSASSLSNGCATGNKQQAWNLRKARAHTSPQTDTNSGGFESPVEYFFVTFVVVVREPINGNA